MKIDIAAQDYSTAIKAYIASGEVLSEKVQFAFPSVTQFECAGFPRFKTEIVGLFPECIVLYREHYVPIPELKITRFDVGIGYFYCFWNDGSRPYATICEMTLHAMLERGAYVNWHRPDGRGLEAILGKL